MNPVDAWFDPIYARYHEKMVRLAFYILDDENLAQDIAHTAFLTLLTKYDRLREHPNIQGWLTLTVRNLIMTEMQKARYSMETSLLPEFDTPAGDDVSSNFLSALPQGLQDDERQLLYLYFEAGFHHEEIAARLGCSKDACRMRLYRAKKHCRELLLCEKGKD